MRMTMIRKYKAPSQCTYLCSEYPSYTGLAHKASFGRSSILLYHDAQEEFKMSKKSLWDIVKHFPLRFLGFNSAPYYIYDGCGDEIGYSKRSFSASEYTFHFAQSTYILRAHSGKKHSLTMGERQIALFFLACEGEYHIDFAEQDHALIPLLLLFAAFIDVQNYAYRGATTYTFVPGDKHKELANWKPN